MLFFFKYRNNRLTFVETFSLIVSLLIIHLTTLSPDHLNAQISQGGLPASFNVRSTGDIPVIELVAPDLITIRDEDLQNEKMGITKRVGIDVPAGIDVLKDSRHEVLPDGTSSWRMAIYCRNAQGIGLYFDDFHLEEDYRLFVYDESGRNILGAYTLLNNKAHRLFSTEILAGEKVIVEINADPGHSAEIGCNISTISYFYDELPDFLNNRGTSDDCEVNINCPEGMNWQYQKHGVARIYVKQGGGYYWCSGSLLNNTLQNNEPFLLTADHCGPTASEEDFAQWIFYFNYEAPACENPVENPVPNTMTGAVKLANANTTGSDFLLIRLEEDVPENYQPYYCGWSTEDVPSPNGVTIHHPAGDIKKISTYTQPIESSAWLSTPGTHWMVYYSETETNWGVTEGGSSGAPLFDQNGYVIGSLTGGQAACEPDGTGVGPDKPDYFGKFSYSWDQNGNDSTEQLKCWLDPINSGVTTLQGKNARLTAAFQASETLILAGASIEFANLSSGLPVFWEWSFEGGEPGFYSGAQPGAITYPETGEFNVRLVVSDGFENDTLLLHDYIHVVGKVYPNPTTGLVNIYLEEELPAPVKASIYDVLGHKIFEKEVEEQSYPLISFDLGYYSAGVYTIRLEIRQRYIFARIMRF